MITNSPVLATIAAGRLAATLRRQVPVAERQELRRLARDFDRVSNQKDLDRTVRHAVKNCRETGYALEVLACIVSVPDMLLLLSRSDKRNLLREAVAVAEEEPTQEICFRI